MQLIFIFFALHSSAQEEENLVENGSFELAETAGLKKFEMLENAEGWRSATYTKADLFSNY